MEERPESVDDYVTKIINSGSITKERVLEDIGKIPNPFSVLDYLDAIETYVGLNLEETIIKTEESLPTLLKDQRQKAITLVREKSERDDLTRLYNRGVIENGNRRTPKEKYAVLMLDIDRFKRINDTYGHRVGDLVLKNVAKLIQENARESFVGRYGGEEFYVELNQTDKEGGKIAAERIRKAVEKNAIGYTVQDSERIGLETPEKLRNERITLSIGIADEHQGKIPDYVRDKADKSLYLAKKYGKNMVVVDGYDPYNSFSLGRKLSIRIGDFIGYVGKNITNLSDKVKSLGR